MPNTSLCGNASLAPLKLAPVNSCRPKRLSFSLSLLIEFPLLFLLYSRTTFLVFLWTVFDKITVLYGRLPCYLGETTGTFSLQYLGTRSRCCSTPRFLPSTCSSVSVFFGEGCQAPVHYTMATLWAVFGTAVTFQFSSLARRRTTVVWCHSILGIKCWDMLSNWSQAGATWTSFFFNLIEAKFTSTLDYAMGRSDACSEYVCNVAQRAVELLLCHGTHNEKESTQEVPAVWI